MNIDGIIFDLDGTLWDSCRVVSESWGETLRRQFGIRNGPTPAQVKRIMGMTADEIADTLFSGYGEHFREICVACIHGENDYIADHGGDVYPGVPAMLEALSKRYPLFIVSNCLDGYIECFLKSSGLSAFFRDWACEGSTGLRKAGNISLIAGRHGLRAPVYIGDTVMDERSAREAGCPFIHAAYGFGSAERPDAVAAAPAELPAVIARLEGVEGHA